MTDPTLPDELRGEHAHLFVPHIDALEDRSRTADLSPAGIADLADAIAREGLLQPIGVVKGPDRYRLIWGLRRLTAYRMHADRLGQEIQAMVYPDDLPVEWAKVLEIDENARRQDLTADERTAHTVELAAEIKKIESQAEVGKSDLSDFTVEDKPKTGRGHKGIYQKVAERQKIDQAAVRKRVKKVAEVIGEPVDLQADTPEQLTGKAAKFRKMAVDHDAERKASRKKALDAHKPVAASGPPDLAGMVRDVNAAWASDAVDAYGCNLTDGQKRELRAHLPDLQSKLARVWEHAAPQRKKGNSRAAQLQDAASDAQSALEALLDLQAQYQEWRDGLPENLAGSALGEKLDAVCELDLEGAQSTISEAEGVDLPQGFGRD